MTNGTGVDASRKYPAITRRVEMLGQLNDRLTTARSNWDRQVIKELAIEYESIGCPHKAEQIRMELRGIRRRRVTGYASGTKRLEARKSNNTLDAQRKENHEQETCTTKRNPRMA